MFGDRIDWSKGVDGVPVGYPLQQEAPGMAEGRRTFLLKTL